MFALDAKRKRNQSSLGKLFAMDAKPGPSPGLDRLISMVK